MISWFTGPHKYSYADKRLFTPVIHGLLRSRDSPKAVRLLALSISRVPIDNVYMFTFSVERGGTHENGERRERYDDADLFEMLAIVWSDRGN